MWRRPLHTRREDTHSGHTGLLQLPSQARHTLCTHAGRIRTVSTRASSSPVRLATRSVHTQGGYALWAHGPPPAPQSGSPHALYTRREDTHCEHTGLLQLPSQARHTLCTHAGRIRTVGTRASSSSPVRLATRSVHTGRIRTVGTRASSSSPVRLATRSVHTQGGYALWAHGPPPAPQSGSPHALYTRREDTHCEHTGLLQLPSQARHTLCTHAGRIRTVGTRASSSSPVRLATRSVHTQGGYALWAHGPPPAPQSGSPHALYTQGGYALWAHGPPPAPQSGSPHALYTRREDTHCGHTGLLQLPSQARHTLCTHAGRIRTVSTRASSSSPVRLATRSVHTQGGYALWAHGPPPAPQSGSPHALHTRREDTHCEHTGLQLPSQARHTLCTHAGRIRTVGTRASSSSPVARHTLCTHAGRIRTVSTRASSSSPVRLATRSVHTQGGYALWAHGPPPAPQSGSPHALYTHREDTHCVHTGLLQLPSQARHTLCGREDTHWGARGPSSAPVRLATRSVHTQGGYALWSTRASSSSPVRLAGGGTRAHSLRTHAGRIRTVGTRASSISPVRLLHALYRACGSTGAHRRIRPVCVQSVWRASSSSPVRLATRSVHTQGGYALWAHGPPPAPQSGSPHALYRAQASLTGDCRRLCAHGPPPERPQSGSPHALRVYTAQGAYAL